MSEIKSKPEDEKPRGIVQPGQKIKLVPGCYYRMFGYARSRKPVVISQDGKEIFRGVGGYHWQEFDKIFTATSGYFDPSSDSPVEVSQLSLVKVLIFGKYNKDSKCIEVERIEEEEIL